MYDVRTNKTRKFMKFVIKLLGIVNNNIAQLLIFIYVKLKFGCIVESSKSIKMKSSFLCIFNRCLINDHRFS